jgi:hypothetical protein
MHERASGRRFWKFWSGSAKVEEMDTKYSDHLHLTAIASPTDPPLLDPVTDMGVSAPEETAVIEKLRLTEERLVAHELHQDPQRDVLVRLCEEKDAVRGRGSGGKPLLLVRLTLVLPAFKLGNEISLAKRKLRESQGIKHLEELKARKRVLRRSATGLMTFYPNIFLPAPLLLLCLKAPVHDAGRCGGAQGQSSLRNQLGL